MSDRLLLQPESPRLSPFPLETGVYILGRSSKCDLVLRNDTVSRRHAEITVRGTTLIVRDLGSSNGTFIEGRRVVEGSIRLRQLVRFGGVSFLLVALAETDEKPVETDSDNETAKSPTEESPEEFARARLSKAQRRVFVMLLKGLSERQIAAQLKLSPTTVHNHTQAIYRVFNVHSRSKLLAWWLQHGES